MTKLENKIIKKLEEEGRITHIPAKEAYKIWMNTYERMVKYKRGLMIKAHASYENARRILSQRIISPTCH